MFLGIKTSGKSNVVINQVQNILLLDVICRICQSIFNTKQPEDSQTPQLFCEEGHSFCKNCCRILKKCPYCKSKRRQRAVSLGKSKLGEIDEKIKRIQIELPLISYKEVKKSDREHDRGAFADVYYCQWNSSAVALKTLRFEANQRSIETLTREAAIGFQLQHPNIVQVFGITKIKENYLGIIMEWSDLGTLYKNMNDMNEEQKVRSSLCICEGLAHMHSLKVAHRDLKPQNVLLFGNKFTAKISDFGTSKMMLTIQTSLTLRGTPRYSAPELSKNGLQNLICADIYSFLVVLYELFGDLEAFPELKIQQHKNRLKNSSFPDSFPKKLKSLVLKGTSKDPSKRPKLDDIRSALEGILDKNKCAVLHSEEKKRQLEEEPETENPTTKKMKTGDNEEMIRTGNSSRDKTGTEI